MAKAKRSTAKKSAAKKSAAKKGAAKKRAPAKKSAAKKAAPAKRAAAKKSVAKKSVAKKSAAKKSVAKKSAAKKRAPAKKGVAKKSVAKKSVAKKRAPAKKSAAKRRTPARKAAAKQVSGVPAGFHTITPSLTHEDTAAAIDWYAKAFGAKEISRMPAPDGKSIWHAEIQIGDSMLYMNDESPMSSTVAPHGPRTATASIQIYVPDADALANGAIEAGAKVLMPMADMFWGDRMGVVEDPFGHVWMISTRTKNMTEAEMAEAGAEFAKQFAGQPPEPAAEQASEPAAEQASEPAAEQASEPADEPDPAAEPAS